MTQRRVVLVHGAWCGGWVWRDVVAELTALGHTVFAPTLTGLGEDDDQRTDDIGLSTHVDDIVAQIELEDLTDIDLVGWSYGGMVITGVIARVPHRLRSACYLDAFVPENGQSLVDMSLGATAAIARECEAARRPFPIRQPEFFGVKDERILAYCRPRLRPQPWKALVEPVVALPESPDHIALCFVLCTEPETASFRAIYERLKPDPRWVVGELATNHFAPLTDPVGVTRLILSSAERP
jgi:pimeloyl-ACP methyl ester carboxylesterase